jgi:hypothetical protein
MVEMRNVAQPVELAAAGFTPATTADSDVEHPQHCFSEVEPSGALGVEVFGIVMVTLKTL